MNTTNAEKRLFRLGLQFFGEDSAAEGAAVSMSDSDTGEAQPEPEQSADGAKTPQENHASEVERLDKLVQSKVDRLMAEERKKNADLQKKLNALSKEKLSDDELKKMEIEEREKSIAMKEKELRDRENRLYAIKAIKSIGLDDGSDKSLELIDFVIGEDEKAIDARVKAFSDLVKRFVSAEVDKTFKANGRIPNGARADAGREENKSVSIAEALGKKAAQTNEKANSVLSYYLGGKKQ